MDDSDPIHNNPLHELAVLLSKGKTGMICAVIVQREGLSKYVGFNSAMDRNGRDSHFLQNFYSLKKLFCRIYAGSWEEGDDIYQNLLGSYFFSFHGGLSFLFCFMEGVSLSFIMEGGVFFLFMEGVFCFLFFIFIS